MPELPQSRRKHHQKILRETRRIIHRQRTDPMLDWNTLQAAMPRPADRCRPLPRHGSNVVFGDGNPEANRWYCSSARGRGRMRISRATPSSGPPGRLLDEMLAIIDLGRQRLLHHQHRQMPPAPEPRPAPVGAARPAFAWLRQQIKLLQPKLIVCLGRIAAIRAHSRGVPHQPGARPVGGAPRPLI